MNIQDKKKMFFLEHFSLLRRFCLGSAPKRRVGVAREVEMNTEGLGLRESQGPKGEGLIGHLPNSLSAERRKVTQRFQSCLLIGALVLTWPFLLLSLCSNDGFSKQVFC